ncbi:unnamed protein product, partial [Symbiodinium pilosum]
QPKAELQLALGKEQQKHAILVERSEQLDLVAKRRGEIAEKHVKTSPADVALLASEVRDRTQQVVELLAEIDELQRAAASRSERDPSGRRKSHPPTASTPSRDLLEDAAEALVKVQLRCEDMERQRTVIEKDLLQRQGESWGQELAALHAELSRKTAQL